MSFSDERPDPHSAVAVPVAVDEAGALVRPDDADPATAYRCPGCGADLIVRRGELRRAHFAHRRGDGCSTESTLHRAAKRRLVQVVDAWLGSGGPRPCISRPCPTFSCDGGVVQDLPADVSGVAEEVRLEDGTIGDVVLFRDDGPCAVIEVVVTHSVGREKASRLGLPWLEVEAEAVLDRPYWWVAVQDGLEPFTCPACSRRAEAWYAEVREVERRARVVAERLDVGLPPSPPYHSVAHECWRCGSDMLVYSWPGGGSHSVRRPPDPIPTTVQHRVTDGGGNYWANCCPRCSAVQGDYYLARDNGDYAKVRALPNDTAFASPTRAPYVSRE